MAAMEPQQRLDVLNTLEKLRNPAQGNANRYFKRYIVRGEASLVSLSPTAIDHAPIQVALRDLGGGGVGFISEQPLDEHELYRVDFLDHGFSTHSQNIAIRHGQKVDDGIYLIGAVFCSNPGLLIVQGVDPVELDDFIPQANAEADNMPFLSPEDLAESA